MAKLFTEREIRAVAIFLPLAGLLVAALVLLRPKADPEAAREAEQRMEQRADSISLHPFDLVIGLIAGGDGALRKAVERAEDDLEGAWRDLAPFHPTAKDTLIGIAASGTTPYVIGGLREARKQGLLTGAITCNPSSAVAREAEYALEAVVGPEFVTGSTRMKAGTAQKLMLNMISTSVMIKLGRVEGNRMVNMQITNNKLVGRGTRMIAEAAGIGEEEARELLLKWGSVKKALEQLGK